MFIVGDDYWGKVDWVPGMFFVKTRFLHIWWFPLVPRESYLFFDDQPPMEPPRAVRIPMRWKSVLLAWWQAFALVWVLILLFAGGALLAVEDRGIKIHPIILALICWGIAFTFVFFYWLSCQWMSPSLSRALQLGAILAIPPETVELQFKIAKLSTKLITTGGIPIHYAKDFRHRLGWHDAAVMDNVVFLNHRQPGAYHHRWLARAGT